MKPALAEQIVLPVIVKNHMPYLFLNLCGHLELAERLLFKFRFFLIKSLIGTLFSSFCKLNLLYIKSSKWIPVKGVKNVVLRSFIF